MEWDEGMLGRDQIPTETCLTYKVGHPDANIREYGFAVSTFLKAISDLERGCGGEVAQKFLLRSCYDIGHGRKLLPISTDIGDEILFVNFSQVVLRMQSALYLSGLKPSTIYQIVKDMSHGLGMSLPLHEQVVMELPMKEIWIECKA